MRKYYVEFRFILLTHILRFYSSFSVRKLKGWKVLFQLKQSWTKLSIRFNIKYVTEQKFPSHSSQTKIPNKNLLLTNPNDYSFEKSYSFDSFRFQDSLKRRRKEGNPSFLLRINSQILKGVSSQQSSFGWTINYGILR